MKFKHKPLRHMVGEVVDREKLVLLASCDNLSKLGSLGYNVWRGNGSRYWLGHLTHLQLVLLHDSHSEHSLLRYESNKSIHQQQANTSRNYSSTLSTQILSIYLYCVCLFEISQRGDMCSLLQACNPCTFRC